MRDGGIISVRRAALLWSRAASTSGWAGLLAWCMGSALAFACAAQAFFFFSEVIPALLARPSRDGAAFLVLAAVFAAALSLSAAMALFVGSHGLFGKLHSLVLFSAPVSGADIFIARFAPVIAIASWPQIVLAIPAALATCTAFGAGTAGSIAAVAVLLIATVFAALVIAAVLIGWPSAASAFSWLPAFDGTAIVGIAWVALHYRSLTGVFRLLADPVSAPVPDVGIGPSFFLGEAAARMAYLLSSRESSISALAFILAAFTALIFFWLLIAARYGAAARRFIDAGIRHRVGMPMPVRRAKPFPRHFPWGHSFLFEREWLMFARDRRVRGEFLPFFFLVAAAILAIGSFSRTAFPMVSVPIIARFSFLAVGVSVTVLSMRLAFSSFSREGDSLLTLVASPMHVHELYSWKFFFWSAAITLSAIVEVIAAARAFALPVPVAFSLIALCAAFSCTASSIAVSSGALRTVFAWRENGDNAPTVVATAVCLLVFLVFFRYIGRFADLPANSPIDVTAVFGSLIVTVAITGTAWYLGHRAVAAMRF